MTRSHHRACTPWRLGLLAGGAAVVLAAAPAGAVGNISWVDWTSWSPSGAQGVLAFGDEEVNVTFAGEVFVGFIDGFQEPYWGYSASTYLSSAVKNPPPYDALILAGGTPDLNTLSFSQVVGGRPLMAIGSLGLTNASRSVNIATRMEFQPPVQLQVLSNGPNYYAGGQWTPFSTIGATLVGVESSGTVRLNGISQQVQWRSPVREETNGELVGTYMFTVGVDCNGYRLGPNPMTQATAVPRGCSAWIGRDFEGDSFAQQAKLQVRGDLQNVGSWTTDEVLVTSAGRVDNRDSLIVGEQRSFESFGRLSNSGTLDVRGTLSVLFGGTLDNTGTLTLKGGNTFPTGGRLLVDAGAQAESSGALIVEAGARLDLRGGLRSTGSLRVDDPTGLLQVASSGRLDVGGTATIMGGIDNAGVVSVLGGGTLVFDRNIDFVGSVPLLDNRNLVQVQAGGLLLVTGSASPGFLGGSGLHNRAAGTLQVDGTLQLDGTLTNAGRLVIGGAGEMVLNDGIYVQSAGALLDAAGTVRAEGSSRLDFQGGTATVNRLLINDAAGRLDTQAGARLTVGAGGLESRGRVVNRGTMVLQGFAAESFVDWLDNRGTFNVVPGAQLFIHEPLTNSGRFEVDGRLFLGAPYVRQSDSGVFINNGTVTSSAPLVFLGGDFRGRGEFDTSMVTFGDITFEQATNVSPGNSPGTMRVRGDMELAGRTTLTMEFSDHQGGDRLVVSGRLIGNGNTMRMVFVGDEAPGLDQIFDFLSVGAGAAENLRIVADAPGTVLDFVSGRTTETGQPIQAVAFVSPWSEPLGNRLDSLQGGGLYGSYFLDGELRRPNLTVSNLGTLGIRNSGAALLEVDTFYNSSGAALLNSGRVEVRSLLYNDGLVKVRAGAQLVHDGRVINLRGARMEVRGEMLGGASSYIENNSSLFEVHGRVAGQSYYGQSGVGARTVVNGRLEVPEVYIRGGVLSGTGRVVGDLRVSDGGRFEPGPGGGGGPSGPGTGGGGEPFGPGTGVGSGPFESGTGVGDFRVDGYFALEGGELVIDLAADGVSDRLLVDGGAALNSGLLRLRLAEGLVPTAGSHWTWLQMLNFEYPAIATDLPWVLEAALPGGGFVLLADNGGVRDGFGMFPQPLQVVLDGGEVRLQAMAPVPEPESVALWLAGLGLLGAAVRRRQKTRA